jgi:hypothetical protein
MVQVIAKIQPAARASLAGALGLATWIGGAAMVFGFASWLGAVLASPGYLRWIEPLAD